MARNKVIEKVRRQIYLPNEDWDYACKYAKKIGETPSYVIRQWVREGVKREKGKS